MSKLVMRWGGLEVRDKIRPVGGPQLLVLLGLTKKSYKPFTMQIMDFNGRGEHAATSASRP